MASDASSNEGVKSLPAPGILAISNCPPIYSSVDELSKTRMFGQFGGRFIPETLVAAHEELERVYVQCTQDPKFREELELLGRDYIGRSTPMYHAKRLSESMGGAQIWLKREELAFTGSHKINNALGQALVAKRIGKKRVIAETGAGQHGVATATACALLGLECVVYMGEEDVRRQGECCTAARLSSCRSRAGNWTISFADKSLTVTPPLARTSPTSPHAAGLNVFRMKILGATVIPVTSGSRTLKDAINEAMRDWVTNVKDTHYIIGTATGERRGRLAGRWDGVRWRSRLMWCHRHLKLPSSRSHYAVPCPLQMQAPTRSPPSCVTSSPSSAVRPARRCWSAWAACQTTSSPASAAAPTPLACSLASSRMPL